jgi:hypothetical protein
MRGLENSEAAALSSPEPTAESGPAVGLAFAWEGPDVAIFYPPEDEDAKETERLVTEAGRRAIRLPGDIGDRSVCETVARDATKAYASTKTAIVSFTRSLASLAIKRGVRMRLRPVRCGLASFRRPCRKKRL